MYKNIQNSKDKRLNTYDFKRLRFFQIRSKSDLKVILLFCMALLNSGCGDISRLVDNLKPEQPAPKIQITYREIAPQKWGGLWSREILVKAGDKPLPNIVVEAQNDNEGSPYYPLHITNSQGVLRDTNTTKHKRYRVGASYVSPWFEAKQDLVWHASLKLFEVAHLYKPRHAQSILKQSERGSEPIHIRVSRLFIPQGHEASWNRQQKLIIHADELVIDGTLRAFRSGDRHGLHAPNLKITTTIFRGEGDLLWFGAPGAHGAHGRAGPAGENGAHGKNGQNGGNGGLVEIDAQRIDVRAEQIESRGGEPGLPGKGGKGGPSSGFSNIRAGIDSNYKPAGRPGKNGIPGQRGLDGEVIVRKMNSHLAP